MSPFCPSDCLLRTQGQRELEVPGPFTWAVPKRSRWMEVTLGYKQLKCCLGICTDYWTLYSRQQILNCISGGTNNFQSARYSCKWRGGGAFWCDHLMFFTGADGPGCSCSQILFCITRKCIPSPSKLTRYTHVYRAIYISTTKLRLSGRLALKPSLEGGMLSTSTHFTLQIKLLLGHLSVYIFT